MKRAVDEDPALTAKKQHTTLENIWLSTTCGELRTMSLVTLTSTMSVPEACTVLTDNSILCAPVYDEDTKRYLGMFDWRDVGVALVHSLLKSTELKTPADIAEMSKVNVFYTVEQQANLITAMEYFGKGVHRVLVTNPDKTCVDKDYFVGSISQSDALAHLSKYTQEAGLGFVSVSEVMHEKVTTVSEDCSVLEALACMQEHNVSSAPIVNAQGVLQGTISWTDVKYIFQLETSNTSFDLNRPCIEFVNHVRRTQGLKEHQGKDRVPVFWVREDDSLETVLKKMLATRAHRLWVKNSSEGLSGVISASDLLRHTTPKNSLHFWHPNFVPAKNSDNE